MATTISRDDIVTWANRFDAPGVLPELVRRLILATSQPQTIEFPAHGGTRYGGWDGTVISTSGPNTFFPTGLSYWELSTNADVKKKLDKDYAKRTKNVDATFVAVTARGFSGKEAWARKKAAESKWAEVRVLDADDIATWLAEAPAVAVWFASEHLGRPEDDILTAEEYLDMWSKQTNPALPRTLLLLGGERQRALEVVRRWVVHEPRRLAVSSDTRDEALRFVACALLALPDAHRLAARTLVIRSERALRWAERQRRPLILIPTLDASGLLSSERHHIALAIDREGARRADVDVRRVPYTLAEAELTHIGMPNSRRIAEDSQGVLPALARLCGAPARPAWATQPSHALLSLLLAGEWLPSHDGDMAALMRLTGAERVEIEGLCTDLTRCADPPLRLHRGSFGRISYRWSSFKDAWSALSPALTDALLENFRHLAVAVLGEEDPVFTLPQNERFSAPIHGKVHSHSKHLRIGIASSIARLSLADELLSGVTRQTGSSLAALLVSSLLRPGWLAWASLSSELPTLAEASPREFLDALTRSLDEGTNGVAHLFREEGPYSNPHTGVLWALERLAWSPERMPRVAKLLARLAVADPGGTLSNRPSASLENLLNPFCPATNATIEQRAAALNQLHIHCPSIAWALTLKLVKILQGAVVFSPTTPQFLEEACEMRTVSAEELSRFGSTLADLLRQKVGTDIERWVDLVQNRRRIRLLSPAFFDILEAQVAKQEVLDTEQRLRNAIRAVLHSALNHEHADDDQEIEQLQRIYQALTPNDPVRAIAWLFGAPALIPERFSQGWRAEAERLHELRQMALLELTKPDDLRLLKRLCQSVTEPREVGQLLGRTALATRLEPAILDMNSEDWSPIRPSFFAAIAPQKDGEWTLSYLNDLASRQRTAEAILSARLLPWRRETWDLLENVDPAVKTGYWNTYPLLFPQHDEDAERVVFELVNAGAHAQALDISGHCAKHLSSELLLKALDAASKHQDALQQLGSGWEVQQIFERLNGDATVGDDRLVGLELQYLGWLEEPSTPTRPLRLFRALERQPELFAQLVAILYRPDVQATDDRDDDPESKTGRQAAARNAYRVLTAWKGYPGMDVPAAERTTILLDWSRQALALTERSGRSFGGEVALAHVLARVSAGADEIWPCEVARILIEDGRLRFRDELGIAKQNFRGMWSKRLFEGGRQELALANEHRAGADRFRKLGTYPETAALLDRIAEAYEKQARREDLSADDERLEAGLDGETDQPPEPPTA
jgi:hypothetical protein